MNTLPDFTNKKTLAEIILFRIILSIWFDNQGKIMVRKVIRQRLKSNKNSFKSNITMELNMPS